MLSLMTVVLLAVTFHAFLVLKGFITVNGAMLSIFLVVAPTILGRNVIGSIFILLVYSFVFAINVYKKGIKKRIYEQVKQSSKQKSLFNVIGKVLLPSLFATINANDLLIAVLAYGAADSVGSQIGVLSKSYPVLITTFRKVPPGTNGAISKLGTLGGVFAGGILGLLFGYFGQTSVLYFSILGAITGFFGSLIDSIVGATIEQKFNLSDWSVNFIASLSISVITYVILHHI